MSVRMTILLCVLALVSALWAGIWVHSIQAENKSLTALNKTLSADLVAARKQRENDQQVAGEHVAKEAILATSQRKTHVKLQAAVQKHARWADERVPDDVARALGM